mmetsp:Transcript_28024/g.50043  ORF Transcript_28024/g.50043 Transcript_28024/m.50043 type:complete len:116 (-) Transcript_28024:1492-1839(-)
MDTVATKYKPAEDTKRPLQVKGQGALANNCATASTRDLGTATNTVSSWPCHPKPVYGMGIIGTKFVCEANGDTCSSMCGNMKGCCSQRAVVAAVEAAAEPNMVAAVVGPAPESPS